MSFFEMMKNIKIELEPKCYHSVNKSKRVEQILMRVGKLTGSGSQTPSVTRGFAEIRNR